MIEFVGALEKGMDIYEFKKSVEENIERHSNRLMNEADKT